VNADRASATARLIAAATVMRAASAHGVAGPEGAAEWCQRFLSTTRANRLLCWSARSRVGRLWWRLAEWLCLPGIVSHWLQRKRVIDRLARQAAQDGFDQLVVIGAGLDTLTFRLGEEQLFDGIVSIDHPATLAVVRAATARVCPSPEVEVELVPHDLAHDDVDQALAAARTFDASRATLVVVEGVLMYLTESRVQHLLRTFAGLPAPRVQIIASSMIAVPGEPIGFRSQSRVVARWLRRRNEPMLWASTHSALPVLFSECGWGDAQVIDLSIAMPADPIGAVGLSSEVLVVAESHAK
jgi:methyltransferase (TIGR00027 family)